MVTSNSAFQVMTVFSVKWLCSTYDRFIHSHSAKVINQPSFWYVVSNPDSSLYLSFCLLLKMQTINPSMYEARWRKRDGLITKQTFISFAISGVRFICWFIPDLAASIVDTVKSLIASCTFSSVARWDLVQELINKVQFCQKKNAWTIKRINKKVTSNKRKTEGCLIQQNLVILVKTCRILHAMME